MRGERIIDITVCVARSLPVAPLAHFEAITGADNGERGGAATTAPAAGNAEHDLHDLKQIDDAAQHPSAERHADGEREDANERVKDAGRCAQDIVHRRSSKCGRRTPPITTNHQPLNAQTGWSRMVESNHHDAATNRICTPLHPASRKQRNQAGSNVGDDCQRSRPEHIQRLYYHSRPTDSINRNTTTVTTATTSMKKSDSATTPPIHDIQHDQYDNVHHELKHRALILHNTDDISATVRNRQVDSDPHQS